MAQLTDLRVDSVSLVDRAAVRSPTDKNEPRRFLLFKREGTTPKKEKTMTSNLAEHLRSGLREHGDEADPDVAPRLSQIADMLDERADDEQSADDEADERADLLVKVAKAATAGGPLNLVERTRLAKDTYDPQMKYLEEVSPRSAAIYKEQRERLARS